MKLPLCGGQSVLSAWPADGSTPAWFTAGFDTVDHSVLLDFSKACGRNWR